MLCVLTHGMGSTPPPPWLLPHFYGQGEGLGLISVGRRIVVASFLWAGGGFRLHFCGQEEGCCLISMGMRRVEA